MSAAVSLADIVTLPTEAAVLPLEMTGRPTEGRAARRLAELGGEALAAALRKGGFLPVGSAEALEIPGLPFGHVIATAVPRWLTGKANELLALRRCYEAVYEKAAELGLRSLASPFLSSCYYHFPLEEAVHIALSAAEKWEGETLFAADTEELLALSRKPWRRPQIVSYVGWYRDHALFELDNGQYARVDLRPELRRADRIPYFEACYREGNNPLQPKLPAEEIERLRRIWDDCGI